MNNFIHSLSTRVQLTQLFTDDHVNNRSHLEIGITLTRIANYETEKNFYCRILVDGAIFRETFLIHQTSSFLLVFLFFKKKKKIIRKMNGKIVFPTYESSPAHALNILFSFLFDMMFFLPRWIREWKSIWLKQTRLFVVGAGERRDDLLHGGNCQALDIRNR